MPRLREGERRRRKEKGIEEVTKQDRAGQGEGEERKREKRRGEERRGEERGGEERGGEERGGEGSGGTFFDSLVRLPPRQLREALDNPPSRPRIPLPCASRPSVSPLRASPPPLSTPR